MLPPTFDEPFDWSFLEVQESLIRAAKEKRYHALYSLLDSLTEPLTPYHAHQLVLNGLQCSIRAFRAILDHCPPVEAFSRMPVDECLQPPSRLPDAAARLDRPEHLDELLRRGCDPNGDVHTPGSTPLAAALEGQSLRCVKRLLREPGLDCTLSEDILSAWAKLGLEGTERLSRCCRMVAPRLLGEADDVRSSPFSYQGTPLPRQMTVSHALEQHNWELAIYLCRRDSLPVEDGLRYFHDLKDLFLEGVILSNYRGALRWRWKGGQDGLPPLRRRDMAALLDAFFTAWPQLLRRRLPQTLLFLTVLAGKSVPPELRPWLERVPNRTVILDPSLGLVDLSLVLPFWEERLGSRWVPALDPRSEITYPSHVSMRQEVETLFSRCRILGLRPGKQLTELSLLLLHHAPMPLLLQQLQGGGLLQREDPELLLNYCSIASKHDFFPHSFYSLLYFFPLSRQRQQAVRLHVKTEVDYEL